jgi:hypothetical protein
MGAHQPGAPSDCQGSGGDRRGRDEEGVPKASQPPGWPPWVGDPRRMPWPLTVGSKGAPGH